MASEEESKSMLKAQQQWPSARYPGLYPRNLKQMSIDELWRYILAAAKVTW